MTVMVLVGGATAASADESNLENIEVAFDLVERVAPTLDPSTDSAATLRVDDAGVLSLPDLSPGAPDEARGVSITILENDQFLNGDAKSGLVDGVEAHGIQSDVSATSWVAQATDSGARLIPVAEGGSSPSVFKYQFDVPDGAEMVASEAGFLLLHGDDLYGFLDEP
ncbi:MAG: hypothetical protein Q4G34_06060 [Micrococcus sp.]|nr:hypothetical protein [Micrococcus sp.]